MKWKTPEEYSNRHRSLAITQPRVDDCRLDGGERFSSNILPRYMRRIPSIDSPIPLLYLKGISINDFRPALTAILGKEASGLSATNIARLKKVREKDYDQWKNRDLPDEKYVYF